MATGDLVELDAARESRNRVKRAKAASIVFVLDRPSEYVMYMVQYGSSFSHLYALRDNGLIPELVFVDAISHSFISEGRLSYLKMVAQRGRVGGVSGHGAIS